MLRTLRVSGPLRNTLRNTKGETGGSLIYCLSFSPCQEITVNWLTYDFS